MHECQKTNQNERGCSKESRFSKANSMLEKGGASYDPGNNPFANAEQMKPVDALRLLATLRTCFVRVALTGSVPLLVILGANPTIS